MAKKKESDVEDTEEDGEDTTEAKSASKVKPAVIGAVLLLLGVVLGGKVMGGTGSAEASLGPTTTTVEPNGPVTTIDAITMNLADGRFLKVGIAIEVRAKADYPDLGGAEPNDDDPTKGFARELDAAIDILGNYSFSDLVAPSGRAMAKDALLSEMQLISDDNIKDLYFHVFVMQ